MRLVVADIHGAIHRAYGQMITIRDPSFAVKRMKLKTFLPLNHFVFELLEFNDGFHSSIGINFANEVEVSNVDGTVGSRG